MLAPGDGRGAAPPVGQLSGTSLEAFSAAELAVAGAAGVLLLAGAAFVGAVALASRAVPVLAPFTALWAPRVALQLAGALCLGAMAVRLPSWWSTSDAWVASTSLGTQALLCRLSVAVAYGAALPLLSALTVCISAAPRAAPLPPPVTQADSTQQGQLSQAGGRRVGTRVLTRALLAAAPVTALQVLIAFHDPIFGRRGGVRRAFGPRFVDTFVEGDSAACGLRAPPGGDQEADGVACALCTQPLLASAVSGAAWLARRARQPTRLLKER